MTSFLIEKFDPAGCIYINKEQNCQFRNANEKVLIYLLFVDKIIVGFLITSGITKIFRY